LGRTAGAVAFAGISLAACAIAFSPALAVAQTHSEPVRQKPIRPRLIPDHFLPGPSIPPSFSIPVDPLGFSAPGPLYLGARNTLASLDFMGEDKLLFTFRVPGLLHRDRANGTGGDERQIRAVVLDLPKGNVEAETVWTLHDRARYLWMLQDGHFLLRDGNDLKLGDAMLRLKPFLRFPGALVSVALDPTQQFIVANSHEPDKPAAKPPNPASGSTPSGSAFGAPATGAPDASVPAAGAAASPSSDADSADDSSPSENVPSTVVRILRRDSGQVILVSRSRAPVELPINADGYIENLRGQGWNWNLSLNSFKGEPRALGAVESHCDPTENFLDRTEFVVTACAADGSNTLIAMTTAGRSLWADNIPAVAIWPAITIAPGGRRIARETLGVSHPINDYVPIDPDDIRGQWVTVYDAATGDLALETPASPALDVGGNVAISPSGRRVAVLNAGAIQIFELPAPPPLPGQQ
jgi:hypothetical protein